MSITSPVFEVLDVEIGGITYEDVVLFIDSDLCDDGVNMMEGVLRENTERLLCTHGIGKFRVLRKKGILVYWDDKAGRYISIGSGQGGEPNAKS